MCRVSWFSPVLYKCPLFSMTFLPAMYRVCCDFFFVLIFFCRMFSQLIFRYCVLYHVPSFVYDCSVFIKASFRCGSVTKDFYESTISMVLVKNRLNFFISIALDKLSLVCYPHSCNCFSH